MSFEHQTFGEMGVSSFPLSWPAGWKRTSARRRSIFKTPFERARKMLFNELSDIAVIVKFSPPVVERHRFKTRLAYDNWDESKEIKHV